MHLREVGGRAIEPFSRHLDPVTTDLETALLQHLDHVVGSTRTHGIEDELHGPHAGLRFRLPIDGETHPVGRDAHESLVDEMMDGRDLRRGCHGPEHGARNGSPWCLPRPAGYPSTVMHPSPDADKTAWRVWATRVRETIDGPTWANAVATQLLADRRLHDARWVAGYAAFGHEADLTPVAEHLAGRWALPRITPGARALTFHEAVEPLERHAYGMQQPHADAPRIPDEAIDLVLVPGLAFDRSGVRLGYGGGYYDAWLAALPRTVPRIGVTHDTLLVEALPTEMHDQRVGDLVTSTSLLSCR